MKLNLNVFKIIVCSYFVSFKCDNNMFLLYLDFEVGISEIKKYYTDFFFVHVLYFDFATICANSNNVILIFEIKYFNLIYCSESDCRV